ncbi:MAG: helix-turn-helix transcriptional regulator [Paracoccus sp. (in: a-proteobacteria)]
MARTDRLMRLMDVLRRLPQPVTAARLAAETGVSPRQLYRDIATLRAGGALIDGEAGLGYRLTEDPALPPQSFTRLEIEALHLAVMSLGRIGDDELTDAGQAALARIIATLPERQSRQALHAIMHSFAPQPDRAPPQVDLALLREACWQEQAVEIDYTDLNGAASRRVIWPLGLSYTERALLVLAHCRLRMDFRMFHVNRIAALRLAGDSFRPRRVALLRDYRQSRRNEAHVRPPQA